MSYRKQVQDLLEGARLQLSNLDPSDWAEQRRILSPEVTSRPGPFKFDYTPYWIEPINRLRDEDDARIVAIMKGLQIGCSRALVENGIGWIISESPGRTLYLSGAAELAEEAMNMSIDQMIDSCGLRPLIRPNVLRTRNQRTGDTSKSKEFPGGSLVAGSAGNHNLLRQRDIRYGFIDDFDGAKASSAGAGSTRALIEGRFASYYTKMKLFYISTPELKQSSNIEPVFLLGDQRRYNLPCPCCGDYIPLFWTVDIPGTNEKGGMVWKLDNHGRVIPGSVGYVCQICAGFFDDSRKYEMNINGEWRPTAEPSEIGYYSYHISSLYAPPGHYDWEHYARKYTEANPPSGRIETLYKTFVNVTLGETYEHKGHAPDGNQVQSKMRDYKIGIVPEWQSEKDGNGQIVMLTCACDLNGTEDDARLDWEIVAWAESGSSYSIRHGSIGTFVYREGIQRVKTDRERWTYNHNSTRSVWPELEKILKTVWKTTTGRSLTIVVAGIDCGHYTTHAYAFIDKTKIKEPMIIGVKGDKEEKYRKYKMDMALFKPAKERAKLYLLDVNYIKDLVAENIKLEWDSRGSDAQPPGYMNFPSAADGLYQFENYFKHYEAEQRTDEIKEGLTVGVKWQKKNTNLQNHFWDVCIYNFALKELWAAMVLKEAGLKGTWSDFVKYILMKD